MSNKSAVSFISELRRRNVFKVASVYLVTSWLLLQIIAVITPALQLPAMFATISTVILGLVFPVVCILAWAFELTPEGVKLAKNVDQQDSIRHETGRKINLILVGAVALLIVFIVYDKGFSDTVEPADGLELSIAVLPFQDMSPDSSQEYFGDGIAEEILNSLARIDELVVISRTSSFKFKNQNDDIRTIGELLDVNYVLEGSVRKDQDMVRITAQLIEAQTGAHLWSQTYDRKLEGVFALQDELTYGITQALKMNLLPEDVITDDGMTTNEEAYELMLRGRSLSYERNAQSISQAIEYLEQAVAIDPEFYLAHAQLYIAYQLAEVHGGATGNDAREGKESTLQQLQATNQDFPLKTLVKGLNLLEEGRSDLAPKLCRLAKQQAPSDSIINNSSNLCLLSTGDLTRQEALENRIAFARVDPLDEVNLANIYYGSTLLGDYTQARYYLDRLDAIAPEHSLTAGMQIYEMMAERPEQALEYIAGFRGELSTRARMSHIDILLTLGRIGEAIDVLDKYAIQEGDGIEHYLDYLALILAYIEAEPALYGNYADLLNQIELTEAQQAKVTNTAAYHNGNPYPLISELEETITDSRAFVEALDNDFLSARAFAYVQKENGVDSYAQLMFEDGFVMGRYYMCRESQTFVDGCPLLLYLYGDDSNDLFDYVKQRINQRVGPTAENRFLLTSVYYSMLHDHPEFKPMAEAYLEEHFAVPRHASSEQ